MIIEQPLKPMSSSAKDTTQHKHTELTTSANVALPLKITDLMPTAKDTTQTQITDLIPSVEGGYQYACLKYNYFYYLYQYNTVHQEWLKSNSSMFTANSGQTFFSRNGRLYYAFQFSLDFSLPTKRLFESLEQPCSADSLIESELIYALHELVKFYSAVPTSNRRSVVYFSNNPDMFTAYNKLVSKIILIDGNLYYQFSVFNIDNPFLATYTNYLSYNNYQLIYPNQLLSDYRKILSSTDCQKKLNYDVKKTLSQEFVNVLKLNTPAKFKSKTPKIPYYLSMQSLFTAKHQLLYYDKKSATFKSASLNKNFKFEASDLISPSSTIQSTSSFGSSTYVYRFNGKLKCTLSIVNYLYYITSGDLNTLDALAKLYACKFCPENLKTPFTVIYDKKLPPSTIWDLLFPNVSSSKPSSPMHNTIRSIKDLASSKNILELINCQHNSIGAIIITECNVPNNKDQIHTVKKIINGDSIKYNDKVLGDVTLFNTLPTVFFAQTLTDINDLALTFSPIKINLSHITEDKVIYYILSPYEAEWLHINFAMYGLSLLASDGKSSLNLHVQAQSTHIPGTDDIFHDFIQNYCTITGNIDDYVVNTILYELFAEYVVSTYRHKACGQKSFISKLNKLDSVIPRKQHHDSTGNFQCTRGIRLKENIFQIKEAEQIEDDETKSERWLDLFSNIDNLVPNELYEAEESPVDVNVAVKYQ